MIFWTWRICIGHTPTKCLHSSEAAMSPCPFRMGSAFQGCITQETWTSAGQQPTTIICFWIKPWICHLAQSLHISRNIGHSLSQFSAVFQSVDLMSWYNSTIPLSIIKGSPDALPVGRWVLWKLWKHFKWFLSFLVSLFLFYKNKFILFFPLNAIK